VRTVSSAAAREDVRAQFRYYALDQGVPDVGFDFLDAVEAAIVRIGAMPAIGAPQYFDTPALAGVRAWPVPGFEDIRVYYVETADALQIIRVLHDKRDVRRILRGVPQHL
jgi:plasmid stabilization system protein ParE